MRRALVPLVLTVALGVGLAGCGDDGDDEETGASTTTTTDAGSTGDAPTTASTPEEPTTTPSTTGDDGSSSSSSVPEGDLPGEPVDIYPYEGAVVSVVGVAAGDTLNVRSGPGTDFDVVTELGPLSAEVTATGNNRSLDDDSFWVEVEVEAGGTTGWANGLYLAQAGGTTDVTSELPAISAETMAAIGEAVAAARAPSEEGPTPTVTIVDGPTVADVGEVTVDVVGLADDAHKGERLHIVASPDASGEGFTVTAVEVTALCARGVTDGLCV